MDSKKKYTPSTKTIAERLEHLEKCCEESTKFKLESEKKIASLQQSCKENRKIISDLIYYMCKISGSYQYQTHFAKFMIDNFDLEISYDDYKKNMNDMGLQAKIFWGANC
jgi:hypothetical protein